MEYLWNSGNRHPGADQAPEGSRRDAGVSEHGDQTTPGSRAARSELARKDTLRLREGGHDARAVRVGSGRQIEPRLDYRERFRRTPGRGARERPGSQTAPAAW